MDSRQRQEIQSSLKSIVESSDKWLDRLKKRQWHVRIASSLLVMFLAFFFVGGGFLGLVIGFGLFGGLASFLGQRSLDIMVASSILVVGLIAGAVRYLILRKKHRSELKEFSSLITKMKKVEEEPQGGLNDGEGITVDALSMADKIFALVPELSKKRVQDSLLFGAVAFILAEIISGNAGVAILVGVIVWLYFRWENRRKYEEEITKFNEQKRVFDQRKKDFMETL